MYPLAILAGIPLFIVQAYACHAENIHYVNAYPTGVGRIRRRSAGIAQGCPWAMRFLAILFKPWISIAKQACTINPVLTGILADDLFVWATGDQTAERVADALLIMHEYIVDIRGFVKVKKTWAIADCLRHREALRATCFPGITDPCCVVRAHRDLGGHVESTPQGHGTTLTNRITRTLVQLRAARGALGGSMQRTHLATAKFLPAALYSAATAPANQSVLDAFSSALVRYILGPAADHSNHRSFTLTFQAHRLRSGRAADPVHWIFNLRVMALRRAIFKQPHLRDIVDYLEGIYRNRGRPGTAAHACTSPPHARCRGRGHGRSIKHWSWDQRPHGPVALLLQNAHIRAGFFAPGWILQSKHAHLHITEAPFQLLPTALREFHATADFWTLHYARLAFARHHELDMETSLAFARERLPRTDGLDPAHPGRSLAVARRAAIV